MSTHRTNAPRRDRIILRDARTSCTVYTAFQESDRDGFVESHGRFLRREAGGSFWGWRDEHPGRSSWFRPSSTEEADLMRFENAKHFLHIDSNARVTAIQYGVRRTFSDDQWSPLQWKIKYRSSHDANQRHWNRAWLHTARTTRGAIASF